MSDHVAHAAPAHAKLNLALAVGQPDEQTGYHPIASLFTAIDLHDTVSVRALHDDAAPSQYAIAWDDGADTEWPSADDLAVKAHRAIERLIRRPIPIQLTVTKRIPAGGGLGGGSSDAAAEAVPGSLSQAATTMSILRTLARIPPTTTSVPSLGTSHRASPPMIRPPQVPC